MPGKAAVKLAGNRFRGGLVFKAHRRLYLRVGARGRVELVDEVLGLGFRV